MGDRLMWFKVDDGFYSSRKVIRIPRAKRWSAIGLWILAGTWCAQNLTDGRIEHHELEELGGRESDAESLVKCGLWETTPDGYLFHDWEDYQPTREQVMAQRDAEAERKRQYRENKRKSDPRPGGVPQVSLWDNDGTPDGQIPESGHPDPTRPDPTRPVPKGTSGEAANRGSRIPLPFLLTVEMRDWAAERTPAVDVVLATEMFVNYWRAKSGKDATKKDWLLTWRNWMLREQKDRGGRPSVVEHGRRADEILKARQSSQLAVGA